MSLTYTKTLLALRELASALRLEGDEQTADALTLFGDNTQAHMRLTNMLNDPSGVDRTTEPKPNYGCGMEGGAYGRGCICDNDAAKARCRYSFEHP